MAKLLLCVFRLFEVHETKGAAPLVRHDLTSDQRRFSMLRYMRKAYLMEQTNI